MEKKDAVENVEDQIKKQEGHKPPENLAEAGERISNITENSVLDKARQIEGKWMPGAPSGGIGALAGLAGNKSSIPLLGAAGLYLGGWLGLAAAPAGADAKFHGSWNKHLGLGRNICKGAVNLFTPIKGKTGMLEAIIDNEVGDRMGKKIEGDMNDLTKKVTHFSFLNFRDTSRKMMELSTKVEVCQDMEQQIEGMIGKIQNVQSIYSKFDKAGDSSNFWNQLMIKLPEKLGGFPKPSSKDVKEMTKLKDRIKTIHQKTADSKRDFDSRIKEKFGAHNEFREKYRDEIYTLIDNSELTDGMSPDKAKDNFDDAMESAILQRGKTGMSIITEFITETFKTPDQSMIKDLQKMMPILCTFRGRSAYSFELSSKTETKFSGESIIGIDSSVLGAKNQKANIKIGEHLNINGARCTGSFVTKEGVKLPKYEGDGKIVYFNYSKEGKLLDIKYHPKDKAEATTTIKDFGADSDQIIINPTTKDISSKKKEEPPTEKKS